MLCSDIAKRVKKQFGDEIGEQIDDTDILRWINDAMMEIVIQNDLLQVVSTTSTFSREPNYLTPTNINKVFSVKWQGNSLKQLNLQEAEEMFGNKDDDGSYPVGSPEYWWMWGNTITLYPAPQQAGSKDLRMFFLRNPVPVSDMGEIPEIPTKYHLRIVDYCIAQAAELDDNNEKYTQKRGEFDQHLSQLRQSDGVSYRFYPFISTINPSD